MDETSEEDLFYKAQIPRRTMPVHNMSNFGYGDGLHWKTLEFVNARTTRENSPLKCFGIAWITFGRMTPRTAPLWIACVSGPAEPSNTKGIPEYRVFSFEEAQALFPRPTAGRILSDTNLRLKIYPRRMVAWASRYSEEEIQPYCKPNAIVDLLKPS